MQSKNIKQFIALSNSVKDIYSRIYLPPEKIEVIPNMIDPMFLQQIETHKPQKVTDKKVILFVGVLSNEKGVSYLIRAFRLLHRKDTVLWIVGTGTRQKEEELKALVEKLEIADRVRFWGHIKYDEVFRFYQQADLFVHSGIWPEPFGRTILEAMIAQLPVIATDTGGPAEVVLQKELLIPVRDPKSLAEKIDHVSNNLSLMKSKALKDRNYVLQRYSQDRIVNEIVNLYNRLLEK